MGKGCFALLTWKRKCAFLWQGESPLRRRPKGFPIALWKPSVATNGVDFLRCRGTRLRARKGAAKTDEVCDRPLDPFGAVTPMLLGLYCGLGYVCNPAI